MNTIFPIWEKEVTGGTNGNKHNSKRGGARWSGSSSNVRQSSVGYSILYLLPLTLWPPSRNYTSHTLYKPAMATTMIADARVEMATSRDGGQQLFVHRPGNNPTLWYAKRGCTVTRDSSFDEIRQDISGQAAKLNFVQGEQALGSPTVPLSKQIQMARTCMGTFCSRKQTTGGPAISKCQTG